MKIQKIWPIGLFLLTLIAALTLGLISVKYYRSLSQLQSDNAALSAVRSGYEDRVKELQKKLIIQKTVSINIPSETIQQNCKNGPFGFHICIPEVKTSPRSVQQVVNAEDPQIRTELDAELEKIKNLSSINTQSKVDSQDLKSIYDFAHDMMKPIISLVIMFASLFIILSKNYTSEQEKWAFGSLGTIIGIWLK